MDFHLIVSNSTGEFVGAIICLFAAFDTIYGSIADKLRGGATEGFRTVN